MKRALAALAATPLLLVGCGPSQAPAPGPAPGAADGAPQPDPVELRAQLEDAPDADTYEVREVSAEAGRLRLVVDDLADAQPPRHWAAVALSLADPTPAELEVTANGESVLCLVRLDRDRAFEEGYLDDACVDA